MEYAALYYTDNSPQYTRLTNTIMSLLDAVAQTGNVRGISADSVGRSVTLQYMFTNYVYFALDNPDSDIRVDCCIIVMKSCITRQRHIWKWLWKSLMQSEHLPKIQKTDQIWKILN